MASTSKNPHAGFRDGDVWLRARLDDAVQLSEAHSCPRFVGFLDERQRAMAQAQLKAARGVNVSFYGGHDEVYPDAGASAEITNIENDFLVTGEAAMAWVDRKSTRLNSSHRCTSRMPSSA